jgi:predicted PurR-regulated permease PerM
MANGDNVNDTRIQRFVNTSASRLTNTALLSLLTLVVVPVFLWLGNTYYSNVREDNQKTVSKLERIQGTLNSTSNDLTKQVVNLQGQLNLTVQHNLDVANNHEARMKVTEDRINAQHENLSKTQSELIELQRQFWRLVPAAAQSTPAPPR